ncbi:hypothetical protein Poli38472_002088 [Pythium oligandrum]|uniref:FHA domain-containing protein n=1 Tax=Pythium oligandrum TaxID=41045 RepID=A0A8K1CJ53_PYTOL|nr:hypothetical protein Poli38472_002088 [Pythium oligandrum]|eukprot:TMW63147.1 hypothetical protein Poli38472_002088 [Pythium oligandrum]
MAAPDAPALYTTTPSRATFLSTGTADFHPPDWACLPLEACMHARFEAFRDSRHCATYMVATKKVNVFGRDQENCDHVLGNPSVSRKHAAVIHDNAGGIYIVDLMSRHGTYVGKKKIPPHDPHLLHEGDVVKFGQSVRVYVLKGAMADGASAPVKKTWGRVKIRAPKISAVLPKRQSRPKYTPAMVKLVNEICYGTMKEEKMETFVNAVMELRGDEAKEIADLLVEKVYAKFEFYAAHVHRNAYEATVALLKRNLLVEEFEANLGTITVLSQQRHDSIYRKNARKILQIMAAVRLDPDNVHSPINMAYGEDGVEVCPPTANNVGGNVIYPPQAYPKHGSMDETDHMPNHSRQGSYGSTQYGDDDDTASQSSNYQPPTAGQWQTIAANASSNYHPPAPAPVPYGHHGNGTSSHSQPAPLQPPPSAKGISAFGFISSAEPDDDDATSHTSSAGRRSATGFDFIARSEASSTRGPAVPRVRAEEFLVEGLEAERDEFDEMWDSTNESAEWAVELSSSFDQNELQACLEASRIKFVASDKVGGMQQLLFAAEQEEKGTYFLVEIMVMPGHTDMTVTFKWIVNSLLYENGHELFIELFKFVVYPFCGSDDHQEAHTTRSYTSEQSVSQRPTMIAAVPRTTAQPSIADTQDDDEEYGAEEEEEEEEEEWDAIPVLDYLTENASMDPARFEQLWGAASVIGTVSYALSEDNVPEKDDVITLFQLQRLSCLASGSVDHLFKFYFFGEMTELQCLFCVEMVIDVEHGIVSGTIKRFAFQPRVPEEEEHIDASFVDFFEKIVQSLDEEDA